MTALLLSGCESVNKSREYVDFDVPHLTTMTMTTTVPVDTYSEYMETYTPTETTTADSNRFYYQGAMTAQGIYVDTMATNGMYVDTMATVSTVGPVSGVTADTPMTTTAPPISEPGDETAETVTATVQTVDGIPAVPGSDVLGTQSVPGVQSAQSGYTVPSIPTDTAYSNTYVSAAHTAGSVYSDTAFSNNVTAYTGTVQTVAPDTMYRNTSATTNN